MENNFLKINKILLFCLFALSVVFVFSFFHRTTNGDEAIIAEHAYHFNQQGFVKSVMFEGMGENWEIRQYHYHKLFVLCGAVVLKATGLSLFSLRSLSFIFFLLSLYVVWLYMKSDKGENKIGEFMIYTLILLINSLVFEYSFLYRPEIMVMSLGFISFYFLNSGLQIPKLKFIVLSGIFAGLGALTHLNGLSFIFAGFVLLLLNKRFKSAFIFGIVATSMSLLYFFDIASITELKAFWAQFSHDPNLSKDDFSILGSIMKVINEQMRFFWNIFIIPFSLTFILTLIFLFKTLKTNHRNLLFYFFALLIGLASVSHGKTVKYAILYFPYMCLIITLGIRYINKISLVKKVVLYVGLSLFAFINLTATAMQLIKSIDSVARAEEISKYMPKKQTAILCREYFFFNQIDNYTIHIPMAFELLYNKYLQREPTKEDFFTFAEKNKNQYIVIDKYADSEIIMKLVDFYNLKEKQKCFNYEVIKKTKDFAVLEIKSDLKE